MVAVDVLAPVVGRTDLRGRTDENLISDFPRPDLIAKGGRYLVIAGAVGARAGRIPPAMVRGGAAPRQKCQGAEFRDG